MNLTTTDTHNDLLNDKRRTRAESARINGAKSRGPKTPKGKAKSSRNALRHGLLAKRIAPLYNASGEREDYEHHLRGLKAEFDPQTPTELNLIESIARDWVRHARIGQMSSNLLVNLAPAAEQKIKQTLSDLVFERQCVSDALASLDESNRFTLTGEQQAALRGVVSNCLRTWTVVASLPEDPATAASLALCRQVDPVALGLSNSTHVQNVIAGKGQLTDNEAARWVILLRHLLTQAEARVPKVALADHEHERACRNTMVAEVNDLPHLDRLMELEAKGQRGIQRSLELLMSLRRNRTNQSSAPC